MPTQSGKTILLATDLQQSVLTSVEAGQAHPIAHTPYGHRPPGSGVFSLIGFTSQLPDPLTGHYHLGNGYRQYNPVLMRFNSPDSWSPFGRGWLNAYMYCAGDPVNRVDPNGHFFKFFGKILGFRPNAATNKAATINKNIDTYPYIRTRILRGNKNIALDPFSTTDIRAVADGNNVYVEKGLSNKKIAFSTRRRVYPYHGVPGKLTISESYAERLTSMTALDGASPGDRAYVHAVNTQLERFPKGLKRAEFKKIKHPDNGAEEAKIEAANIRTANRLQNRINESRQRKGANMGDEHPND